MIVCDTGPIFAAADRKDADHHRCVELFTSLRLANRRLLLPRTVLAAAGYLLEVKTGTFAGHELSCDRTAGGCAVRARVVAVNVSHDPTAI